jgi:DNA replication protein DnaT
MGRIRTIKPEFTTDEELSALPAETHLFAAGLLCYSDDAGYFNANPGLVKAAIFPLRESSVSVPDMLQQLEKIGYLQLGKTSDGKHWGHVVKFLIHQRVNHPTPSKIKDLDVIWEGSRKAPGGFTEDSGWEGKGKEQGTGKGMELPEGTKNVPSSSGEPSPDDCGTDFEVAEQDGETPETPVGLFGEPAVTTGEKPQMAKALREVFSYYLTTMSRNPKTYTFSQLRRRKGMARLEEALRIAHGNLEDAIVLMKAVVDEVALSDWHMGRDPKTEGRTYCEWEDHLFRSTEQFEKWLQKTQEVSRKQGLGARG